jgi:hypothetical protein
MSNFTDSAQSKQIDQREHNNDASAKRVLIRGQDQENGSFVNIGAVDNGDGSFGLKTQSSPALAVRIDDTTTANTTYIGKATIGSATSSAVWQIAKLNTSSGLIKTWADGSSSFDQIWDNRTSLTYQ